MVSVQTVLAFLYPSRDGNGVLSCDGQSSHSDRSNDVQSRIKLRWMLNDNFNKVDK